MRSLLKRGIQFTDRIFQLQSENEKLQKICDKNNLIEEQLNDLILTNKQLKEKNSALESYKEDFFEIKATLSETMELYEDLLKKQSKFQSIESNNKELTTQMSSLESTVKTLKSKIARLEEQNQTNIQILSKQSSESEKIENKNEILSLKVTDLEMRIEEYEKLLEEQSQSQESDKNQFNLVFEKEKKQIINDYETELQNLSSKIEDLNEMRQKLKKVEKANIDLKIDLENEKEKGQKIIQELTEKYETLDKKFIDKKFAFEDLEGLYESNLESLTSAEEKAESLQHRLTEQHEELSKKIAFLELKVVDKDEIINNYEEENERLRMENDQLQSQTQLKPVVSSEKLSTLQENSFAYKTKPIEVKQVESKSKSDVDEQTEVKISSIEETMK